jgi:hypothetical protein
VVVVVVVPEPFDPDPEVVVEVTVGTVIVVEVVEVVGVATVGEEVVLDDVVVDVEEVVVAVVVDVCVQLSVSETCERSSEPAETNPPLTSASRRSDWLLAPAGTVTPGYMAICAPVVSRTVTEQVSAAADPTTENPRMIAIAPASESTLRRTRPSAIRVTADIDSAPQGFFTTSGSIGTLHVVLEGCNLEGPDGHWIATMCDTLRLWLRVSA